MTLEQIRARLAEILQRQREIGDELRTTNDEAGDSPLEGELAERWQTLSTEFDDLDAEKDGLEARAERLERVDALADAGRTESGSIEPPNVNTRTAEDVWDVRSLDGLRGNDRHREVRSRAIEAVERSTHFVDVRGRGRDIAADDARQAVTRLLERSDSFDLKRNNVAEQVFRTLDPEYRDAYAKFMAGEAWKMTGSERAKFEEVRGRFFRTETVERAMTVSNVTGALVPAFLDPTIILTSDGTVNPFRQRCRVESTSTNVWTGVTTAGITGGWTGAEASEVDDDAPSFSNPAVTAYMADAFIPMSFQAWEDWSGAQSELAVLIADYKDVLEGAAFATGSGTNQPTGLVTALDANTNVERETTTSNVFGLVDVYGMHENLPARWRSRAEWFANIAIINDIRQFGTDNLSTQTVDLTAAGVPILLGKRMNESDDMDGAIAAGGEDSFLVYGSPANYLIADRIGLMTEVVPNLFHADNNRPSGQRGILAHWRVGADSINDTAFRLLQAHTNS